MKGEKRRIASSWDGLQKKGRGGERGDRREEGKKGAEKKSKGAFPGKGRIDRTKSDELEGQG